MKGGNVPYFKMNSGISDGTSNIFQNLQDLQQKQNHTVPVQFQFSDQYSAHNKYSTDGTDENFFHTLCTTPSAPAMTAKTAKQIDPVHAHKSTSWSRPPTHCPQVYKTGLQTR